MPSVICYPGRMNTSMIWKLAFVCVLASISLWYLCSIFPYSRKVNMEEKAIYTNVFGSVSKGVGPKIPSITLKPPKIAQCQIKTVERFDCHPEAHITEERCLRRGCCWRPADTDIKKLQQLKGEFKEGSTSSTVYNFTDSGTTVPMGIPACFYPMGYPTYSLTGKNDTNTGYTARLTRKTQSYYPRDVMELRMDVMYETSSRLHIKIYDANHKRYEVPIETPKSQNKAKEQDYLLTVRDHPFSLRVTRKSTGTVILDSSVAPLLFADQFLQMSYRIPSHHIYGLGEHRGSFLHSTNWTRFTLWNKDQFPIEHSNLYGSHPFYLVMEPDGKSHGVFLLNSNAMDVILQPAPAITWRTIGGIFDFYIFTGPNPQTVIRQYTEVIGRPHLPPYWGLGFHLCRWGYKTADRVLFVMERMRKAGIPQDVQWNDIEYSIGNRDFTTNPKTFGDQPGLAKKIHDLGMHYVIIVDCAIGCNKSQGPYPAYDDGLKLDLFVKDHTGKPFVGAVWPGPTVWPDFTHPKARQYWTTQVQNYHRIVPIDGMWIDMNEPSNFMKGSMKGGCPKDSPLEHPPYVPGVHGGNLSLHTICASAQQYASSHYNVHSLYGLTEVEASYHALKSTRLGKRPFIISRSSYPSLGKYAGKWTGDNFGKWYDMHMSIPAILNFNMFGIPLVGADICGFHTSTKPQICQRWHQLGAFYPFSRNHNDRPNRPQDPAAFGPSVAESTRKVLLIRYSLLPYLYTLFHKSNVDGYTVARPLFFEYPEDVKTYAVDKQFLWGPALLISPVLSEDTEVIDAYFPPDVWYDFRTGERHASRGAIDKITVPLDSIGLHVREGHILPMQQPGLTTTESRKNKFNLLVALRYYEGKMGASGDLFWDDGDTIDSYQRDQYNFMYINAKGDKTQMEITSKIQNIGYHGEKMLLGNITTYGVLATPTSLKVNGVKFGNYQYDMTKQPYLNYQYDVTKRVSLKYQYDMTKQVLRILEVNVDLTKPFNIGWSN